jgi:dynamin 1-like protein
MHHIRNTLPEIKAKIQSALHKYQQELLQLGEPLGDGSASGQASLVLNIITEFCTEFRTVIDGNSHDLSSFELSGGARISFVFHELYSNGVQAIDPLDQIKDVDIRTILYSASVSDTKEGGEKKSIYLFIYIYQNRVHHLLFLLPPLPLKSLSSSKSNA